MLVSSVKVTIVLELYRRKWQGGNINYTLHFTISDHLKDIMLDIQIVHPTLPVIMQGDFNIVLEVRDSIIRVLRFLPTLPLRV